MYVKGADAIKLMNIVNKQKVARARIQHRPPRVSLRPATTPAWPSPAAPEPSFPLGSGLLVLASFSSKADAPQVPMESRPHAPSEGTGKALPETAGLCRDLAGLSHPGFPLGKLLSLLSRLPLKG